PGRRRNGPSRLSALKRARSALVAARVAIAVRVERPRRPRRGDKITKLSGTDSKVAPSGSGAIMDAPQDSQLHRNHLGDEAGCREKGLQARKNRGNRPAPCLASFVPGWPGISF